MASSKLAARAMRNHAKYRGRNDLNIVPMIDMMVILVFFLLFTAVFSNTNILELNAAMSPGGTRNPVSPSTTCYGIPPMRDATTALPQAIASSLV
jgi:hypothetical protein